MPAPPTGSPSGPPTESLTLDTSDGERLEAELAVPDGAELGVVVCHPHPQYGGSMRSIVVSALFAALPQQAMACLRFNFRGVEGSTGTYTEGEREPLDVRAALAAMESRLPRGTPIALAGWSFGADMALSVTDGPHRGWAAIAPPLRFAGALDATAADPRPKLVVLAQHDQFRPHEEVAEAVAAWEHATVEVVGGADHFFVGRTDRLTAVVADFLERFRAVRGDAPSGG